MRLIDATEAATWARIHILDSTEKYAILDFLRECTTIDAVPVVRCKDCARRNPSADLTNTVLCTWLHNLSMPKDGFCSYGERRDGEG